MAQLVRALVWCLRDLGSTPPCTSFARMFSVLIQYAFRMKKNMYSVPLHHTFSMALQPESGQVQHDFMPHEACLQSGFQAVFGWNLATCSMSSAWLPCVIKVCLRTSSVWLPCVTKACLRTSSAHSFIRL